MDDILFGVKRGETKRMTARLESVLRRMADEVKAVGFKLAVVRAYRYPTGSASVDTNNLHYEGRAAWVAFYDVNNNRKTLSTDKAKFLMRSAWGAVDRTSTGARADWVRFNPSK
jgi:hypothetical protein